MIVFDLVRYILVCELARNEASRQVSVVLLMVCALG